MNIVDVLALIAQGAYAINQLATIIQKMREEGRDELNADEIKIVRDLALASDARLAAAVSAP